MSLSISQFWVLSFKLSSKLTTQNSDFFIDSVKAFLNTGAIPKLIMHLTLSAPSLISLTVLLSGNIAQNRFEMSLPESFELDTDIHYVFSKVQIISALSFSELFTTTSRVACCLFFSLVSPLTSFDLLITESCPLSAEDFSFGLTKNALKFFIGHLCFSLFVWWLVKPLSPCKTTQSSFYLKFKFFFFIIIKHSSNPWWKLVLLQPLILEKCLVNQNYNVSYLNKL